MKSIHLCLFANKTERAGCWKTMDEIFKFHPLLGSEKWNPFVFLHLVCCYRVTFRKAECRQIRRFPEFQVLPLSAHTARSMTASQNRSTSWNLTGLLCLLGKRTPFLPPSGC